MIKQISHFVQNQHAHPGLGEEEIQAEFLSLLHQLVEFPDFDSFIDENIEGHQVVSQRRHRHLAAMILKCVLDGLSELLVGVEDVQITCLILLHQTHKLTPHSVFPLFYIFFSELSVKTFFFILHFNEVVLNTEDNNKYCR